LHSMSLPLSLSVSLSLDIADIACKRFFSFECLGGTKEVGDRSGI
jgi:hypothetical protein